MKAGERIAFEATGERRAVRAGEWALSKASVHGPDQDYPTRAASPWVDGEWTILRRIPDEQLAAEQRCAAAARAHANRFGALASTYRGNPLEAEVLEVIDSGAALNALLAPKPRYVAIGCVVQDNDASSPGTYIAHFLGPDAERHAREFCERMNGRKP